MRTCMNCLNGTTRQKRMAAESSVSSSDPVSRSCSEPSSETGGVSRALRGGESDTVSMDKQESAARSSEMRGNTDQATSYGTLMQSLIDDGLVKGITPLSMRRRSGQQILDFAFFPPVGVDVEQVNAD